MKTVQLPIHCVTAVIIQNRASSVQLFACSDTSARRACVCVCMFNVVCASLIYGILVSLGLFLFIFNNVYIMLLNQGHIRFQSDFTRRDKLNEKKMDIFFFGCFRPRTYKFVCK